MAFCSTCGARLPQDVTSCIACGTPIEVFAPPTWNAAGPLQDSVAVAPGVTGDSAPPPPAAFVPPPQYVANPQAPAWTAPRPPANASGQSPLTRIVIVLIVAAAAMYYFAAGEDPKAVVNRMLDGVQEYNADKVLSCVRPSDRAAYSALPVVFSQYKTQGFTLQIVDRKIAISDKQRDTCVAIVSYGMIAHALGMSRTMPPVVGQRMDMVKENGHWYLTDVSALLR